jgi:hypothetical protein
VHFLDAAFRFKAPQISSSSISTPHLQIAGCANRCAAMLHFSSWALALV